MTTKTYTARLENVGECRDSFDFLNTRWLAGDDRTGACPGPTAGSGEAGDIPEDSWDCYNACQAAQNFGVCIQDCLKALCELGQMQYCVE